MPTLYKLANPSVVKLDELFVAMEPQEAAPSPEECADINEMHRDLVIRSWSLGPEKASIDPQANAEFWQNISAAWNVTEAEARRQLCANCEYFDNTPKAQKLMEIVPFDKYDLDGGGRGICAKFDFICHNLRTCQAWEEKPFYKSHELDDGEEEDAD